MDCPLSEEDPYFTVKLQDYTAVEKDEVVLDCELSKDVDVMWYHNEAEIKASKTVAVKAEGKRRTLVIKRVGDEDKGQYVCDCGTDKTTAVLHIEGKALHHLLTSAHVSRWTHLHQFLILHLSVVSLSKPWWKHTARCPRGL